jgi:hypothetical protein
LNPHAIQQLQNLEFKSRGWIKICIIIIVDNIVSNTTTQGAHKALATRGPRHCNDVLVESPTPEQNARKPPMVHHVFTWLLCRFCLNEKRSFRMAW